MSLHSYGSKERNRASEDFADDRFRLIVQSIPKFLSNSDCKLLETLVIWKAANTIPYST